MPNNIQQTPGMASFIHHSADTQQLKPDMPCTTQKLSSHPTHHSAGTTHVIHHSETDTLPSSSPSIEQAVSSVSTPHLRLRPLPPAIVKPLHAREFRQMVVELARAKNLVRCTKSGLSSPVVTLCYAAGRNRQEDRARHLRHHANILGAAAHLRLQRVGHQPAVSARCVSGTTCHQNKIKS
jgi:hypothetical protein